MKYLRHSLIITSFLLLCNQISAQTFGIKGGLNLAKMLNIVDGHKNNNNLNPGFHVGGTFDFPLNQAIFIETGLFLNTKGKRTKFEQDNISYSCRNNHYYLDIPFVLKGYYNLKNNIRIYGTAGPYVGIGLKGKFKAVLNEEDGEKRTFSQEIKFGDDFYDNFTRTELGLTFGGGAEINSIIFGISYDHGLTNITSNKDVGYVDKNRVLKFSVGYKFGNKQRFEN